ncbi:MAG: DNA ligase D [Pseudomonadota bacterium]|nr:DNA ligase D [Pseudomonadota bacterium]
MRVATWNVNNVRKRLPQLLAWLDETMPDIVALQELKTETAAFPRAELEAAGYSCLIAGQRTWNGVALLAKGFDPIEIRRTLPGDPTDKQVRFIEAAINGVAVACLYLPNGNPRPGPKFDYKLAWFERLIEHAASLIASRNPVVLLGDFNVVPTDELDIYSPASWKGNALLQPEARAAYARLIGQGWTDALRSRFPGEKVFTFWDYLRNRWPRNAGLRIDHILLSPALQLVDAGVNREMRANPEPSDHAPVWAELSLARPPGARRKSKAAQKSSNGPAPLTAYNAKRDFAITAEPAGAVPTRQKRARGAKDAKTAPLSYVIQKHWASRLHYDFRLELDGVMLSWAVPKGPSYDPSTKSMAIHVEDHPVSYSDFEGTIPARQYGAGTVIVWDRGTWEPIGDPREGMTLGKVLFKLHGEKLAGLWELVRISKPVAAKQDQWMLFKKRGDAWARPQAEYDVITALPDSVVEKPLGLVEEREAERVGVARSAASDDSSAMSLDLAIEAPLPATLSPQLATLAASAPSNVQWVVENKLDGYRLLARVEGKKVKLFTRNGNDWTTKFSNVVEAVSALKLGSAWLDGEIVVLDANGLPSFNALQNSVDNAKTKDVLYFLFDLPFHGGMDLRQVPLLARRAKLKELLSSGDNDTLRFSQSFDATPAQILAAAGQLGMEGVMAKRADSPYVSSRSETWLKLKASLRQEFVVIGFTDRTGAPGEVGGLLLGYHEDGRLRSGGSVGTGWNAKTGRELHAALMKLETKTPAVDPATLAPGRWSKRVAGSEHWVKPRMVVEVAFGDWTPDGNVRHAVFKGVRADKPATEITRERASAPIKSASLASAKASVRVTNPERVIDPTTNLKKIDLVRYYQSIADWILPHLKGRPASLVRAPDGIAGKLFFQKHDESKLPGLTQLGAELWPGHDPLLSVDSAEALVSAAQMNVIEFHTWNSLARNINKPDRVIFDLDPGEGVSWANLQEAAVLMRTLLTELGLQAWLKTSGGKGLHVVVPLMPRFDYETVKGFSQAAVRHMAKVIPGRFVAVAGGGNRIGKIFIDYLRNGHAQTTAAAFSARSRPGLGVSMPIAWEQLSSVKGGAQWTIATAREYVSFQQADPWADYWTSRQSLTVAMKTLGVVAKTSKTG